MLILKATPFDNGMIMKPNPVTDNLAIVVVVATLMMLTTDFGFG